MGLQIVTVQPAVEKTSKFQRFQQVPGDDHAKAVRNPTVPRMTTQLQANSFSPATLLLGTARREPVNKWQTCCLMFDQSNNSLDIEICNILIWVFRWNRARMGRWTDWCMHTFVYLCTLCWLCTWQMWVDALCIKICIVRQHAVITHSHVFWHIDAIWCNTTDLMGWPLSTKPTALHRSPVSTSSECRNGISRRSVRSTAQLTSCVALLLSLYDC